MVGDLAASRGMCNKAVVVTGCTSLVGRVGCHEGCGGGKDVDRGNWVEGGGRAITTNKGEGNRST